LLDQGLHAPSVAALFFHTPTLALVYSAAFFLGCLLRQPVPAAILAFAAALLIYFLPVLFPGLGWLSAYQHIVWATRDASAHAHGDTGRHLGEWMPDWRWAVGLLASPGAIAMIATTCAAAVALAVSAAEAGIRDWRLRVNARLLTWSLAGVALLIFTAGAGQ